jgi:hypothetical protein
MGCSANYASPPCYFHANAAFAKSALALFRAQHL